jgi:hypothetical protein
MIISGFIFSVGDSACQIVIMENAKLLSCIGINKKDKGIEESLRFD